jgi:hypothetical protein
MDEEDGANGKTQSQRCDSVNVGKEEEGGHGLTGVLLIADRRGEMEAMMKEESCGWG